MYMSGLGFIAVYLEETGPGAIEIAQSFTKAVLKLIETLLPGGCLDFLAGKILS